jgi:hypothetical protein
MNALTAVAKDKYESILVRPLHGDDYKNYKHNENRLNFLNSKSFKPVASRKLKGINKNQIRRITINKQYNNARIDGLVIGINSIT